MAATYFLLKDKWLAVMAFAVGSKLPDIVKDLLAGLIHAATLESQLIQFIRWQLVGLFALEHVSGILRGHQVAHNFIKDADEESPRTEDYLDAQKDLESIFNGDLKVLPLEASHKLSETLLL